VKLDELPSLSPVEQVLIRPAAERVREFKYRFAQSLVFGLPVLALHWLGPALGGPEAPRWTGLFQTLLAGWVMYVAAAGMIFEGVLQLLRRKITLDPVIAVIALTLYVVGVVGWTMLLVGAEAPRVPIPFHYGVVLLAAWCGLRWAWLARHNQSGGHGSHGLNTESMIQ
jgi:hypothetical protein